MAPGVGTLLVAAAEAMAAAGGAESLCVVANPRVEGFYAARSFHVTGCHETASAPRS